jgi:hypothetical protein
MHGFYTSFVQELFNITYLNVSNVLKQKLKFYQTILLFKSTKNYK